MKNKGFTLIEIMIVLVIIGILMGLISAAAFKAMESAKKSRAEVDIATLETALSAYEADIGDYPPSAAFADNSFKAWLEDSSGQPSSWNGPYMHFKNEDLTSGSDPVCDPWNNAYKYKAPGSNNSGFVDIYSFGPDGSNNGGAGDDIKNW